MDEQGTPPAGPGLAKGTVAGGSPASGGGRAGEAGQEGREGRRAVFGWAMYDAANSAYATTAAVAVLPAYFAGAVMPPEGLALAGTTVAATTLWGLAVGLSALMVFAAAPWLGAMADKSGTKKRFLALFCLLGGAATMLLGLTGRGDVWIFLGLFVLAQASFVSGNVFYDAFLPEIAPPDRLDRVSAKGFAYGYLGGGLQFALCLGMISQAGRLGLTTDQAARTALVLTGLWWLGVSVFFFVLVPERRVAARTPGLFRLAADGWRETLATARGIAARPELSRFLVAYLLFNDGIQTTIFMATIYGKEELGLSDTTLMLTLLVIQFVAILGAVAFGRLAERLGAKTALLLSLAAWTAIAVSAAFIGSAGAYFALGLAVGLVLGGSQALSRSLFAALLPAGHEAAHFGFFSVATKLSAVAGPFLFALTRQFLGSSRPAVALLALFFLSGMAVLATMPGRRTGP